MARDHRDLIAKLRDALPERIPGLVVLGDPDDRLPHIVTMVLESGVGEEVVIALGKRGISIASGSACTADAARASHVVEALGYRGLASIRVSLPFGCTAQTVDDFADALCEVVSPG
jgi:cysteine desulfurase